MSTRGSQITASYALRLFAAALRHLQTERLQGAWPISPAVSCTGGKRAIPLAHGGAWRQPGNLVAMRSMKRSSPPFLPCLSGHTLRAYSGARRHCRRSAFRTPLPKQVWAPAPESAAWHLGAGPLAQASPMGDPANPGIQQRRLHHVSEPHLAHRIPRARTPPPYTANNANFTVLSLATKSSYKDKKTGEYNGHTEWHRCIVWGKLAEYAKTLKKGAHLAVEGELRSRERTDKKTGQSSAYGKCAWLRS